MALSLGTLAKLLSLRLASKHMALSLILIELFFDLSSNDGLTSKN
jgi:hypothetical protein